MTADDWRHLRNEFVEVFTPGQPINEFELFAGRAEQIRSLQDATLEPGRHAIVYGERGVGKTNIFHRSLNTETRSVRAVPVNANRDDTFPSLWRKTFKRIRVGSNSDAFWMDQAFPDVIDPDDVQIALSNFSLNEIPIIVFDEYDRIRDADCKALMTDTIKALSDYGVNCTIVIVGVAESISALVAEHASISRALKQVPMPRMSQDELADIIVRRLRTTPLHIADDALWRVAYFSRGLPYFTHSLGKYACFRVIERRRLNISEQDVLESMKDTISDIDYTILESYSKAFERSPKKDNIFKEVMLACALTEPDSIGKFPAASVEKPLTAIMAREFKVPSFSYHLKELCTEERGSILKKSDDKRSRFRFVDPRMQPYIILRSLQDSIVSMDVIDKFAIKRRRRLSTEF